MDDPLWDEITDPPRYRDRDGEPMTMRQWSKLFEDQEYKVIEQTTIGNYWVSTVWLGLDHGFSFLGDRPLFFETMVFDRTGDRPYHDLEMRRYSTEAGARLGHAEMVARVGNWDRSLPTSGDGTSTTTSTA